MKTAFTPAEATRQSYVRDLRLHSSHTPNRYLRILKAFQDFVATQADKSTSMETVRQWLIDQFRVRSLHQVIDRACVVNRFLSWMVSKGALPNNPFTELKIEYGQRTTAPVVRALLNPDFQRALEALRPAPRFGSFLGPVMREDVTLMRIMGYRYNTQEQRFLRLDRFLQRRLDLTGQPLAVVIREWASTRSGPQQILECHLTARSLSRALSRKDPATQNIPWEKRIKQEAHQRHRRPYIFKEREIQCLLATALGLPSPQSPLRPHTAHTMLVLAYCSGLRVGEIVRLNVGDFDVGDGIDIRSTKFFKSRRLPLSSSVVAALQSYLEVRQQAGAPTCPDAPLFWHPGRSGVTRTRRPDNYWSASCGVQG
jgi:site-specific recombinase XerC